MRTQLLSHNKTAYQKVMRAFETADRTCVVHPTGTGKSYLIAAVSESFMKLAKCFQKVHNLEPHDLVSYFVITVRNTSLNMLRKEPAGELEYDDNMYHTELPNADEQLLRECIALLPEGDRELLFMRYTLCLGSREIGAALGISDEAARKRVQYVRHKLRALMEEKAHE